MRDAVTEAKMRGEDADTAVPEQQQDEEFRNLRSRKGAGIRIQSLTMKKRQAQHREHLTTPELQQDSDGENENENPACASKENDPSLSPSPIKLAAVPSSRALSLSPRKNAHGKRPLADLTTAMDVDPFVSDSEDLLVPDMVDEMTASERNIAANTNTASIPFMTPTRETRSRSRDPSPQRKSPKLSLLNRGPTNTTRLRGENADMDMHIYEDAPEDGKENHSSSLKNPGTAVSRSANALAILTSSTTTSGAPSALGSNAGLLKPAHGNGMRKVSGSGGLKKAKPRIGIRRL
jgi:ubiquitin-conjugating enzyme E2 S